MDENIARELANTLNDLNIFLNRGTSTSSRSSSSSFNLTEEEKKARQQYLTNFANLTKAELEQRRYEIKNAKELDEVQRQQLLTQAKLEIQRKEIAEQFKQSSLKMIGSLDNLGKAFNDISGDVTKFNSTISMVGDEALALGKTFGTAGTVIGASIKALTFLTTTTLDQTQKLLKGFDDLSSVGATTSLTTRQVMELGQASGYSVANLEKFTKNFIQLGTDLANLGGTASLGAKTFAQITAVGNKTYEAFNRVGISQEQLTEAQAGYVRQAAMSNAIGRKDTVELRKASLDYVEQLVKLRDLTGMNVQKQQQALESALAQENFDAYVNSRQIKAQEIEEQIRNESNEQRKQELRAAKQAIENELNEKKKLAIVASQLDEKNRTAFLQGISTSGPTIMTEAVARLEHLLGVPISKINENANKGIETTTMALNALSAANKKTLTEFGPLVGMLGSAGIEIRKELMFGVESSKFLNGLLRMTAEEREKEFQRIASNNETRLREGKIIDESGKPVEDAAKNFQNAVNSTSRNLATAIDDVVDFINPFTGSLLGATTAAVGLAGAAYLAIAGLRKLGASGMVSGLGASGGGGALGRVIGTAVKFSPLAIAGTLGGTALGAAGDYLGSDTTAGKSLGVLGNAATGAGLGAMLGIPGAIAGGVLGAGYGIYDKFFGKTSNTVAPTATATPAGSSAASATVSTVAQGGQQAVNVNIVGSIPLNVNIEKVLDPLFKLTRTPRQTAGMSEFSLADVNDEITVPVKISAMSEGFETLFKSMNDYLYAIARNTKKDSTVSASAPASVAGSSATGSSATGSSTQMNDSSGRRLTKAERNNNPGNLIFNEYTRGLGAVGQDNAGFAIFPTLEAGTNALQENLRNYRRKGVTQNVESIIEKWSPGKGQGNTQQGTDNYANFVAQQLGVKPNQPININDPTVMEKLTGSIAKFESGRELSNFRNPAAPAATQPPAASVSSTPASKKLMSIKDTVDLDVFREKDPNGHREYVQRVEELRKEYSKKLENDSKFNASMKGRSPYVYERMLRLKAEQLAESQALEEFKSRMKEAGAAKTTVTPIGTKLAKGGMILGPGTPTSDSVPAFNKDTGQPIALSTGEYVLPAGVTSILGKGYLDSLINSPDTLRRQTGGIIPGNKADDKQRELDKLIANIDTILGSGTGLKRQGFSLVEDSSSGIIGVSGSMASESKSMIEATLAKAEDISKRYNVLPTPDPVPIIKASDVTDADFGVSSEMAMPTSNDASQFKFDRAAMLKDTETFQRQQGENLGLSSSQLVDPMREALTPMLDKQDETNKNMLSVLQNMLSVLESSTSIQSNMLNYARM
jgi:hypothetical protein